MATVKIVSARPETLHYPLAVVSLARAIQFAGKTIVNPFTAMMSLENDQ